MSDVLLTTEACAESLGCSPMAVGRLIGRRRLAAVDVGGGPRLLPATLQQWVAAGALDFREPVELALVLTEREQVDGNQAAAGIRQILQAHVDGFEPSEVAALAKQQDGGPVSVPAPGTEIRKLLSSAVDGRLKTLGNALLAKRAIDHMRRAVAPVSLGRLYASGNAYQEEMANIVAAILSWGDIATRQVRTPDRSVRLQCQFVTKDFAGPAAVQTIIESIL